MNGKRKCGVICAYYSGIVFSLRRGENPAICEKTDEPWGLNEVITQFQKEKYCMIPFIWGI